jgi:type IV pilus assembly protein PilB
MENPSAKKRPSPDSSPGDGESRPRDLIAFLVSRGHLTKDQLAYAVRICTKLETRRTLLDVLKELEMVSDEQIRQTILDNLGSLPIGGLLVDLGLLTREDLQVGLAVQAEETPRRKLGEVLVGHHFVEEKKLVDVLSMQLGFPMVEPDFTDIDRKLFSQAPESLYTDYQFVPIRRDGGHVVVAFSDPLDRWALDEAKKVFGERIRPAIATRQSIHRAVVRIRPETGSRRGAIQTPDSPVDVVNNIIVSAIKEESVSDIHMEPMADRFRVRFRRDGVLLPFKDFDRQLMPGVTSRIKVLCGADIAEKRRHQGGRLLFEFGDRQMDMRVSFFVTVHGEKIVLRLLNRQSELLRIEDVGMPVRMLDRFREDALDCPSGVIIITGPTGSGKTTTVYSCVNHLNNPQTSIITAEEPVEYLIDGIAQCSINPKINLTFDETLRHIVRQDPDVIVIGEIRDGYSAGVAVQAALTGHKVLTTFHTEDSIGGLVRLLNMDIDAFLISSTVVCVVAQRLLRRTCPDCAAPYKPTPRDLLRLRYTQKEIAGGDFLQGRGCPACRHTGYRGRIGIFEMLVLNEPVRDAIIERKTSHQIRQISIESTGLVTLMEDGIAKAAAGHTSLEEVLRSLPRLHKPRPLEEIQYLLGK